MALCEEEIDFREEARSIIADVSFAVRNIALSKSLENSRDCVYVNITTLEDKTVCVQLDTSGLKVCSNVACLTLMSLQLHFKVYKLSL